MMLPFETPSIYEQLPRFIFKMPRVVTDQKAKFESDELFRRLSRESEVRYTGYRDRPQEERQIRFQNACREGHTELAFVASGTNLQLVFGPCSNGYSEGCDFDKEQGKVHIKSNFIMNGVCVRYRGWMDLERLDGVGCLEYDEDRGKMEDAMMRDQVERYNLRLRDFEEKQKAFRAQQERQAEALQRLHSHTSALQQQAVAQQQAAVAAQQQQSITSSGSLHHVVGSQHHPHHHHHHTSSHHHQIAAHHLQMQGKVSDERLTPGIERSTISIGRS